MYVVIVVGPVDSVDRPPYTQNVGAERRVTLGCWPVPAIGVSQPCGEMRGNSSTKLSTR